MSFNTKFGTSYELQSLTLQGFSYLSVASRVREASSPVGSFKLSSIGHSSPRMIGHLGLPDPTGTGSNLVLLSGCGGFSG